MIWEAHYNHFARAPTLLTPYLRHEELEEWNLSTQTKNGSPQTKTHIWFWQNKQSDEVPTCHVFVYYHLRPILSGRHHKSLCVFTRNEGKGPHRRGREEESRFHHPLLWVQSILTYLNQTCHPWDHRFFSNHNNVPLDWLSTNPEKTSFQKTPNALCPNLVAPSLVVPRCLFVVHVCVSLCVGGCECMFFIFSGN